MTTLPERILSGEVEAPDVFCGGTPCQAFSVAGLRNSLDDARGNLSLTFVGIANAIDHVRSVRSDAPGIIFWENVPGVLSTKDNAFGCFLGALAGEDDPIIPSGDKWTNAGCVYGPQRTVAWRVLDAQYFGVAQRRRRVFVVASARTDFDPAAVLFEFDGVRRDTAPSREKGKTIAPTVTSGPPFSRTGNERVEDEAMVAQTFDRQSSGEYGTQPIASTMSARDFKCASDLVAQPISIHPHCIGRAPNAGPQGKEYLLDGSAYCMDSRGQPQAIAFHPTQDPISSTDGTTHGLGCGSSGGQASIAVVHPIALQDVRPVKKAQNGKGWNDDGTAYTVDTHATQGVAQPIGWSEELTASIDLAGTIQRGGQGGRHDGVMTQAMAVRRLTPVECERLQGFPDGYTNIPWRKKDESPDGPRYKALGNSWAVPVVAWIGKRIQGAV